MVPQTMSMASLRLLLGWWPHEHAVDWRWLCLQCMSWMVLSWLLIKCCCSGFRAVLVSGHVASLTIRGRGDAPDCDIILMALLGFGTQGRLGPLCDII